MKRQQNLALFTVVVVFMAIFAGSASWWLPSFLKFVGTNTDLIQGLTDFIQIILWIGVFLGFVVKLYLGSQKGKTSQEKIIIKSRGEDGLTNHSVESNQQADKFINNAKTINGLVQGNSNQVTNRFNANSTED